jgi:hypothetical protein
LILKHFQSFFQTTFAFPSASCVKTVSKPLQFGLPVSVFLPCSFACRLSLSNASRFICNLICEYFLNTLASPCRSNWVTHSSATPPAESLVAKVERRS